MSTAADDGRARTLGARPSIGIGIQWTTFFFTPLEGTAHYDICFRFVRLALFCFLS